jgi:hypothetical protein
VSDTVAGIGVQRLFSVVSDHTFRRITKASSHPSVHYGQPRANYIIDRATGR